jgi:hypothetical protein
VDVKHKHLIFMIINFKNWEIVVDWHNFLQSINSVLMFRGYVRTRVSYICDTLSHVHYHDWVNDIPVTFCKFLMRYNVLKTLKSENLFQIHTCACLYIHVVQLTSDFYFNFCIMIFLRECMGNTNKWSFIQ